VSTFPVVNYDIHKVRYRKNTPHICVLEWYIFGLDELTHRLQSSELGPPPPPEPAGECVPSPFVSGRGGKHTRLRERGVGESQFGRGSSRYICTE
jgi:hypothetical protein